MKCTCNANSSTYITLDFSSKFDEYGVLFIDYENIFSKFHHRVRIKVTKVLPTQGPLRFLTKTQAKNAKCNMGFIIFIRVPMWVFFHKENKIDYCLFQWLIIDVMGL